jgi:hypothetical protein
MSGASRACQSSAVDLLFPFTRLPQTDDATRVAARGPATPEKKPREGVRSGEDYEKKAMRRSSETDGEAFLFSIVLGGDRKGEAVAPGYPGRARYVEVTVGDPGPASQGRQASGLAVRAHMCF